MKIAVCDDDSQELARISSFIDTYLLGKKFSLIYKTFQNATELLSTMNSSDYDIVLSDILMPGMTGMKAAHEIRGFDTEVKIVFLTSSPEFAVESYAVKSYDELLSRPEFVKVHRSYIVNLWQVGELGTKELITHAGKTVPISHLLYGKVREAYMKHLFLEKGVE